MNTYKYIAKKHELGKIDGWRFVAYMSMRWPGGREESNCMFGYADEWADRFDCGSEYSASDLEGLRVLKTIDTCENCHERLTSEEFLEAINSGLTAGEVCCQDCWQDFIAQKNEEAKHPDER
jgi:hypothetical protein